MIYYLLVCQSIFCALQVVIVKRKYYEIVLNINKNNFDQMYMYIDFYLEEILHLCILSKTNKIYLI